jgi:hypothetical protein
MADEAKKDGALGAALPVEGVKTPLTSQSVTSRAGVRLPYSSPKLKSLGTVAGLTFGKTGSRSDGTRKQP